MENMLTLKNNVIAIPLARFFFESKMNYLYNYLKKYN